MPKNFAILLLFIFIFDPKFYTIHTWTLFKKKNIFATTKPIFFLFAKKKKTSKQGDKTVCIEMVETLYETHRQFIYCMYIYKDVHNFLN